MSRTRDPRADGDVPHPQYIPAEHVVREMARFGRHRLSVLGPARTLVLAVVGGAFITAGALLSVLVASGIEASGPRLLVEGVAFSSGFFFVVLSEAVLFTEANAVMPATVLTEHRAGWKVARFWGIAFAGNFAGAYLAAGAIAMAQTYDTATSDLLREIVERKMVHGRTGGIGSWGAVVLSGALANWLVGMAAFFATMGRTILGKYVPVALAVTTFVAANFQHSPANMGYFSLLMAQAEGPGWVAAFTWNLIPAGIGNVLGGAVLVALPFWFAFADDAGQRPSRPPPTRRSG